VGYRVIIGYNKSEKRLKKQPESKEKEETLF